MSEKIRWGIVGLGKIAHTFAKDLALVPQAKLSAVASRNLEKAKAFGAEYQSELTFGSYEDLFDSTDVDVVYIATPHSSHRDLAIKAMKSGKHVLCEKPMGVNAEEVQLMIEVAKEEKVFLMEALWSRFNPTISTVKNLIQAGEIGDLKYLHADFAFYALDRAEEGRLLNPALAGGSLLDIGIYPIFLAYLLMGRPESILSSTKKHSTGVEIQTAMIFQYPEAHALLYSGLTSNSEMKAEISGTKGTIYLHPRWHETEGYSLEKEGKTENVQIPKTGKGYAHEIMEVHYCLDHGQLQSQSWSHEDSIELVKLMDEVRRQSGIIFPFE